MYKVNLIDKVSCILVIFGALNWGLFGLFGLDLVRILVGNHLQLIARIIYILIGVAGIDVLLFLLKTRKRVK
ncbi:DUF378 domain-containing protein [Candidatus Clostridium radicumherbarum]|uniref:DUF378 domain-containing protein n=1 Tax=Candidatus Clostridium radicumherbarum TaxID=3381662 RepID=A0ABW8TS68_9CLOT